MKKIFTNIFILIICSFITLTTLYAWHSHNTKTTSDTVFGNTFYEGVEFEVEGAEGSQTKAFKPGEIISLRYNIKAPIAGKKYSLTLDNAKVTYPKKALYDNFVYNTGQYYNVWTDKKYSGELGEANFLNFVNPVTNSFRILLYPSNTSLTTESLKEMLISGKSTNDDISIFDLDSRENGLTQAPFAYEEDKECTLAFHNIRSNEYTFLSSSLESYIGVLVYFNPNTTSNAYVLDEDDRKVLVIQKNTNAYLFQSVLLEYLITEE